MYSFFNIQNINIYLVITSVPQICSFWESGSALCVILLQLLAIGSARVWIDWSKSSQQHVRGRPQEICWDNQKKPKKGRGHFYSFYGKKNIFLMLLEMVVTLLAVGNKKSLLNVVLKKHGLYFSLTSGLEARNICSEAWYHQNSLF